MMSTSDENQKSYTAVEKVSSSSSKPLAKIALWCDTILFVSRLIQKCLRRKFLHKFEDVWSLHICFCT